MFQLQQRTTRIQAGKHMVADATAGAIRVPDASNPGTRSSRKRHFWQRNINRGKPMEYVIVFGVVAMMALYALIIARYLRAV